ncbi:ATP-dependent endonuclease [Mesorhizobium loti NZP2037]|nr:AAA family ATPase [Mesorhizobium loti]ANN57535.1 ATP-dependent endonuclease [Mesorhizobium loti NZP2037]
MHIERVVVENYRCLRRADVVLNASLNILVGDNECGKSTLLEAIHLALTGQLGGRPIATELHPYLFNTEAVTEFIDSYLRKQGVPPPAIMIEIYLAYEKQLASLKGTNNSRKEDTSGIKMSIELNQDFAEEFEAYVADPTAMRTLPVEYYVVRWQHFGDTDVLARTIPFKSSFVDASTIRNNTSANRYVIDILKEGLSARDQVDLALSYRIMKDRFLSEARVAKINAELAKMTGRITDKTLTVSLDTSARASWEVGVTPHLDDIPITLVGKGEQNSVKVKLALESSGESHLVLIEEAENHLSFSRLNELIGHISANRNDRQLIITTHSSFVLNKLGLEAVLLFNRGLSITLRDLSPETQGYFLKLPGYDTLRLILARRAILVEGPSDELIVQRAFQMLKGHLPLEAGVDVISINALAFKRFLEIADKLDREVDVVTDNDGDVIRLEQKYADYAGNQHIRVRFDRDTRYPTLEPQLLKANGRTVVNAILGTDYPDDNSLLEYMKANKTDCALRFFETRIKWDIPSYIRDAIA